MNRKIFIAYDFEIAALPLHLQIVEKAPGLNLTVRWAGDSRGRNQGAIWKDIVHPGIDWCDRLLAFIDLPNANVGYELGFALGRGKEVVVACMRKDMPEWVMDPPMRGFMCERAESVDQIRKLLVGQSIRLFHKATPGHGTLLLCPHSLDPRSLVQKHWGWKQTAQHGWNLNDFDALFENIGRVVWVIGPTTNGPDSRDGPENASLSIIAGYAHAISVPLEVFKYEAARDVADVIAHYEPFRAVDDLQSRFREIANEQPFGRSLPSRSMATIVLDPSAQRPDRRASPSLPRILVVDDDPFYLEIVRHELLKHFRPSLIIDTCNCIEDAINYVYRHKDVKAVVLDVMMPMPAASEFDGVSSVIPLDDGANTGIWFVEFMMKQLVVRKIKIQFITNGDLRKVRRLLSRLKMGRKQYNCLNKNRLQPGVLPRILQKLMQ